LKKRTAAGGSMQFIRLTGRSIGTETSTFDPFWKNGKTKNRRNTAEQPKKENHLL